LAQQQLISVKLFRLPGTAAFFMLKTGRNWHLTKKQESLNILINKG